MIASSLHLFVTSQLTYPTTLFIITQIKISWKDEGVKIMLKVHIDASTKSEEELSGGGILITGTSIYEQLKIPLTATNNHEAEFEVFLKSLEILSQYASASEAIFLYTDSKIVVQTIDKSSTSNPNFVSWLKKINALLPKFPLLIIQWIPESKNKGADNLARQALAKQIKNKKTKNY